LIYCISIHLSDDERPVGFDPHSLLGQVVLGEGGGNPGVWLVVHHRAWCGPVDVDHEVCEWAGELPFAFAYDQLRVLTDEIETLANEAVPAARALQDLPEPGSPFAATPDWRAPQRVRGPGMEISSAWSWFAAAPPKRGDRQWKRR